MFALIAVIVYLICAALLPVACGLVVAAIAWIVEGGRRLFFNHWAHRDPEPETSH